MKDPQIRDQVELNLSNFPSLSQNGFSNGFRLPKMPSLVDLYKCETESIASSSVTSKRRIDMLFNDSRSVTSEYHINRKYYEPRKVKSLVEGGGSENEPDQLATQSGEKNDVQVRIEKMFSEISSSEAEIDTSIEHDRKFTVKHMGSLTVQCKITSLEGLQEPLRELYFKYKINRKRDQTGLIQINDTGLYIEYNGNYGGKIEKLNPFSTIGVWASLRFKFRSSGVGYEYAFLPLINKDSEDKSYLFRKLSSEYNEYVENGVFEDDSPIFVVVMREPDTPNKQMVCHGFVCESAKEAEVMASTLYTVLKSVLGKNRVIKNNGQHRKKPSINRLSSIREMSSSEPATGQTDQQKSLPPPKRPPRRTKLKNDSGNEIKSDETSNESNDNGDILTKVAIPRSNSFLNTNRLSSRYKGNRNTETPAQKSSLSPLGFMEMFNELQSQEGLKTVDEILNVIIKEEGMSFNELKPIYKEFLLKLALVLSKDELYNRSKTIMKKQKIKKKVPKLKKVITTKKGLKNVFRKPLVKLKPTSSSGGGSCSCKKSAAEAKLYTDSTSTDSFFLKEKSKPEVPKLRPTKNTNVRHKTLKFRSQRITSTSEDSDYPNVNHRKLQYSKNKQNNRDDVLRPSSSGYFSFSECSYDTESCTCTSADKCYCSLSKEQQKKKSIAANFSACSCDTLACRKRNKCYCAKPKKLSLVEQLKQKGFAVSESSLSPDDSPTNKSVRDKRYSKLSKSLEYLENTSSSSQYKSRMELYDTSGQKAFPCRHTYKYCPSLSSASSKTSQKKSSSSDNLAVDYSMFAKPEPSQCSNVFKDSPRHVSPVNKQNVVYAELACPQMVHRQGYNHNYVMPQVIRNIEQPPVINMYPHSPIRTCSCACTCTMYHHAAANDMYPSSCCKNSFSYRNSTFFRRMNLENVLGYYP
ncbi:uncharacterized protein LOC135835290 [Planococcus citri]|uniref:uncharacterized protein LOC135835290 n=1 Tax=Planococcus citri TaxID=170843 RepID=UPI0031F7817D